MKKLFFSSLILFFLFFNTDSFAQDYARNWTVQLTADVQESPAEITLNWLANEQTTPTTYLIWRKVKGTNGWGGTLASLPSSTLTYTDNTALPGVSYEYQVQLRLSSTIYAWGYVNAGIKVELEYNKGDMLLIVDSTHIVALSTEIAELQEDLYRDGWMVTTIGVNPAMNTEDLRNTIIEYYNDLPDLTSLYLVGHVPVPYSGNLNPDAHPNHEGAWPADVYYADMNGFWSDVTINNTVASGTRNDNVPGDGKFDQSKPPSGLELEVSRVDFFDLPVYTETEEELLANYLTKAHEFKMAQYVPQERGLVDQGGFTGYAEGFAQSGFRNFTGFFGAANVDHADYWSSLDTVDYLWSYGCGGGSFTSVGGLDNGTSLTSSEIAAGSSMGAFTMLFGSYFGDWDITNNLMKVAVANGKTLTCSWAGRPTWNYHPMAMGENIGYCAKISQDLNTDYLWLNLGGGFVTGEGVHVALLGDPSLRLYYIIPPSNVTVSTSDVADINWTASTDVTVEGYNIYRRTATSIWVKVNSTLIAGTSFTDATAPTAGVFEYMLKSVKLKTNASGTLYNESLGSSGFGTFYASNEELPELKLNIYPNPSEGVFTIDANEKIDKLIITDLQGRVVMQNEPNSASTSVDLVAVKRGVYIAVFEINGQKTVKKLIVQ
ncbi:T9SS type A sorting domain-containing protein [Crocinitomix catalasitica]|nr:T9SS type A sorting domain-containing protein [Crocinitomix catalasitica]